MARRSLFFALVMLFSQLSLGSSSEESKPAEAAPGSIKATYMRMEPPFIANYGGGEEAGRLRFVKVDITLRVEIGGENPIVHHMPALRHELVMLISRQTPDSIGSTEGKELLRQEALEAVRNVLITEEGDQKVADLLFNSFVVQR